MKKTFMIVAAVAALMCSCEHIEIQDVENPTGGGNSLITKNFTFTVKGDFGNPEFSDAGSTRAYMTADGSEMTDLWVIDYKDGKIVQQLHQSPTDADWGAPKMALTLGTHHVYFLASRGIGAEFSNGTVTWTKAHDTFYKDYEVNVVNTSNGNRAVTLDRVGTKMMLTVEDAIPVGTTSLALVPSVWYSGWDMLKGVPVDAPDGYNVTFSLPASYGGAKGTSYAIWSMSGAEEWTTDITITSKAGETTNAEVTITDAPFKANRTTIYRGNLYTAGSTENSVSLNAEWLTSYEGTY